MYTYHVYWTWRCACPLTRHTYKCVNRHGWGIIRETSAGVSAGVVPHLSWHAHCSWLRRRCIIIFWASSVPLSKQYIHHLLWNQCNCLRDLKSLLSNEFYIAIEVEQRIQFYISCKKVDDCNINCTVQMLHILF